MRIAFIGLGNMGAAMAGVLLEGGHRLRVWNRSAEKARPLVERGAVATGTPGEAAADCDVVVTMVADDAALLGVVEGENGVLARLPKGALHISCSTISPACADRVAALHAEHGQRFVSAPVFGRPQVAATGNLWVAAAGPAEAVDAARPVLEAIGRSLFVVGETPSAANLVKLAGNFMILSTVEVMAEAMALAEKGGVSRAQLLEVLTGTLFDAPVYRVYGPLVAERRYRPAGFAATLGLKDLRLVGDAADALGAAMPLLEIVRDHLDEAIAREGGDIDVAALAG